MFPIVELTKPLLLLDVDGVRIPYAAQEHPTHFRSYTLLDELVGLAPCHGTWLQRLCDLFHIVWATGWEQAANRLIAPILRLPAFPVIEFPRDGTGRFNKFPIISQIVPDHPLVWSDDELPAQAHLWAAQRRIATLLIDADPAQGLTEEMVAACEQFAVAVSGSDTKSV